MQNNFPMFVLLIVCMSLMFLHTLKKEKQLINYLFAIFCGSLCMVALQKLSPPSIGIYYYLIGLATCATCNVTWLIARTLFREKNPISKRHILLAMVIAGLIVFNQTWHMLSNLNIELLSENAMLRLKQGMNEITTLLSSGILMLSFWEAFRGFKTKSRGQKHQSVIFASAFFLAVFNSAVLPKFLFSESEIVLYFPYIMASSALLIVVSIQYILFLQTREKNQTKLHSIRDAMPISGTSNAIDSGLDVDMHIVDGIKSLVENDHIYLQANLKIADFAQILQTSEYKVSRAIRQYYNAVNFNSFINEYRVQRAKQLLVNDESAKWSILVVALESGFSSLGTFNRVFKKQEACMPNDFRKKMRSQNQQTQETTEFTARTVLN